MPVVFGSAVNNCSKASRPPAEAPTPTIEVGRPSFAAGNRLNEAAFAGCAFLPATFFGATREARGTLSTLERRALGAFVFLGTVRPPGRRPLSSYWKGITSRRVRRRACQGVLAPCPRVAVLLAPRNTKRRIGPS